MKIAYFDCFAGISGDMMLGALVDCGLDIKSLKDMVRSLGINGVSIDAKRITKKGIGATDFKLTVTEQKKHRHLKDIIAIIESGDLSESTREKSKNICRRISEAESTIHQIPLEKIHFHEVGAADSIIDIIGSVWGLEQLGIEACYCSEICLGSGSVECEHGTIPVPAPATLELVKGFPVTKKEIGAELTTPTGAALVTTLAQYSAALPTMRITGTGYGAGDRDDKNFPNVFRIIICETDADFEQDKMIVAESNVDDLNPEMFPYIMEKLFKKGAVDVFLTPIIMKKGRPGQKITVVLERSYLDTCMDVIFQETTSLGIRYHDTDRTKLVREIEKVQTPWGMLKVKSYFYNGKKHTSPEYEECKKVAEKENIPLKYVYDVIKRIGNPDD